MQFFRRKKEPKKGQLKRRAPIFREDYPSKYPADAKREVRKATLRQIADRVGTSLKASWFNITNPRKALHFRRVMGSYAHRKIALMNARDRLQKMVAEKGIKPLAIIARTKRAYSIYKKAESRGGAVPERLGEALGLRVIARTREECYKILNMLKKVPGSTAFKVNDFIKRPRAGTYRAIHITTDALGETVEVQIRTLAMEKDTETTDLLLGKYKGEEKVSRARISEYVDRLYEGFEKHKSAKVPLFVIWARSSGIGNEYAEFAARVMKDSGIFTATELRQIRRFLKQERGK